MNEMKKCTKCLETKAHAEFYRRTDTGGLKSWCKTCLADERQEKKPWRARYRRDPEANMAANRAWREKNPEKHKAYFREYGKRPEVIARRRKRELEKRDEINAQRRARYDAKRNRDYGLKTKYGITADEWDELFASQGHTCAVCRTAESGGQYWHTDHCHTTGTIRGILCRTCNISLGCMKDHPEHILALHAYLTSSRTSPGQLRLAQ